MKQKIFILTWVSYTDEDDYLYSDVKVFTDEKDARMMYDHECGNAYEECEWGSQQGTPEDERDEDCKYDVDEIRDDNCYTVASSAYNGYKVTVKLTEVEI